MDIFEHKLNMYRNNPQSENLKKGIQIFEYIKQSSAYFFEHGTPTKNAMNIVAYLANVDGVVTPSEILFLDDFIDFTKYEFVKGLTAAKYLQSFNTGDNEKVLLKVASLSDQFKEEIQILGMIMYTYDGRMPSKRKIEFLKKLEC